MDSTKNKINALQERLTFLALCSDYDSNKLLGFEEMTYEDYKRITYILRWMDLTDYYAELSKIYPDFADSYEKEQLHPQTVCWEYGDEASTYKQWLSSFINQISDTTLQKEFLSFLKDKNKGILKYYDKK